MRSYQLSPNLLGHNNDKSLVLLTVFLLVIFTDSRQYNIWKQNVLRLHLPIEPILLVLLGRDTVRTEKFGFSLRCWDDSMVQAAKP